MGGKDGARHPAPRCIADEPEIAALIALVREGKISQERLEQHLQQRQLQLFTKKGGDDDRDSNAR